MLRGPVLLSPVVEHRIADAPLAAHFCHRRARLRLPQRERNLTLVYWLFFTA